ncbi:MAG: choice-of-anchor P family protein [Gammaproteobacteria bacterium]
MITSFKRERLLTLHFILFLILSSNGNAAVIGADSSSYGILIDMTFTPSGSSPSPMFLGPEANAAGTAPSSYNEHTEMATTSFNFPGLFRMTSDTLISNAISNVDGTFGIKFSEADNSLSNLDIRFPLPSFSDFLKISSDLIQSSASASGDFGALTVSANSLISSSSALFLLETLNSDGVSISLGPNPGPNTLVDLQALNAGGIDLILNEQITSGDGQASAGIQVNAAHFFFNNYNTGNGLFNGDIIISHSEANIIAEPSVSPPPSIPEPRSLLIMLLALMMTYVRYRSVLYDDTQLRA